MPETPSIDGLRASLAERFLRPAKLAIYDLPENVIESSADLTPPPGTVTVFFSRESAVLEQLKTALEQGDERSLQHLRERANSGKQRKIFTDEDAVRLVQSADTVFDVRYGGRTVSGNRALPDGEVLGSVVLSWTGGSIDNSAFSVIEYNNSEVAGQQLYYLAYRRAPKLTELERGMLDQIPTEMSEIHLGAIVASETKTMEEVAKMVHDAAEHAKQTRTCGPDILDDLQQLISQGRISPEASVRELVRARLELMTRSMQR